MSSQAQYTQQKPNPLLGKAEVASSILSSQYSARLVSPTSQDALKWDLSMKTRTRDLDGCIDQCIESNDIWA